MGTFISYRHSDTKEYVRDLYTQIKSSFPNSNVFMDVEAIAPGADFREVIKLSISKCNALVVLMGHTWLGVTNNEGGSRLDDPKDYVRQEIIEGRSAAIFPFFPS